MGASVPVTQVCHGSAQPVIGLGASQWRLMEFEIAWNFFQL